MRAPLRHVDGNAPSRANGSAKRGNLFNREDESRPLTRYLKPQPQERDENDGDHVDPQVDPQVLAWRQKWRAIMATAVVYFDDIDSLTRMVLKNELSQLGSSVVPFFDVEVTHVVSDRGEGEAVARALELGVKVYTSKKMSRFLSGLVGKPPVRRNVDAEAAPSNLKNMLSDETRMGGAEAQRDVYQFKGVYVLLWDPLKKNKPLAIAEWDRPEAPHLGSWPQMRLELPGACPFMSKEEAMAAYKKLHRVKKKAAAAAVEEKIKAANVARVEAEVSAAVDAEAQHHKENVLRTVHAPKRRALAEIQEDVEEGVPARTPLAVLPVLNERAIVPETEYPAAISKIQEEARALGKEVPPAETILAELKNRTLLARRAVTAKFGEIAASGMQRYSNSTTQSTFQSGGNGAPRAQASRDLVNLQRKVFNTRSDHSHQITPAHPVETQPEPEPQPQQEPEPEAEQDGETTLPEPDEERTATASPETSPAVVAQAHSPTARASAVANTPVKTSANNWANASVGGPAPVVVPATGLVPDNDVGPVAAANEVPVVRAQIEPLVVRPKKKRRNEAHKGWCENCLARYDNFTEHVQSRAHKNVAAKDGRFASLDGLILMLRRVPISGPSSPPEEMNQHP